MAITLTVNGTSYSFPTSGENPGWGSTVTSWAQAVSQATLQKSGGSFTLTADVDFGANYGIKLAVLKSRTANAAQSGLIRLANSDQIKFRNSTNTADLALGVGSTDTVPAYAGKDLVNVDATQTLTGKTMSGASNTFSAIPWSSVDKTSSNISDLATKSHTSLSDIGTNSHSTIDSFISNAPSTYAPIGSGVTNGDSHDHSGGDGAQIDHTKLSNIGTNTHAQIDTHISEDGLEKAALTQTGFVSWGSGTTYYTITGGKLQVDRGGTGYIKGVKVTWTAGQQTSVLAANTTSYVYMNSSGVIGVATSVTQSTYEDYIILFEVLYDGTNYVVVAENHPYKFNTAASVYLHNTVGPAIAGSGAVITRVATGTGAANGDREVKIVGAATLEDHGLSTTISDSAGAGVTWNQYHTNASGKWIRDTQSTQLAMKYNNAGTATALGSGEYGVYVLYVSKSDLNTSTPTYYAVMNNAKFANAAAAGTAITNNTIARSTNELASLELAQLGYAIVKNSGGGYIDSLTVAKATVNQAYASSGTNQANLVVTNVTAFNGALSSADTTVQAALDTLDDAVVTKTGTQTITNKDIDGGTASDTSRITVPKAATATLEGLTRKQGTIVFDTTTNTPKYDDGSSLVAFTAGAVADTNRNGMTVENLSISATVGSNALTIALKDSAGNDPSAGSPVKIGFRSATATDGSYVVRSVSSATSVVVSSGSNLGTSNGVAAALNVYAVDNAGTVVLGVINGMLDDSFVQSSTAEGGAGGADSAGVLYTTAAQTSKSIRWIGRITVTEATAGTWATAPSQVHSGPRPPYQVGRVDGVAPATGMVGESLASSGTVTASTTWSAGAGLSVSLTPGVWLVSGTAANMAVASGTYVMGYIGSTQMTSGSATPTGCTAGIDYVLGAQGANGGGVSVGANRIVVAANTTYYIGIRSDTTTASAFSISLRAIRIA